MPVNTLRHAALFKGMQRQMASVKISTGANHVLHLAPCTDHRGWAGIADRNQILDRRATIDEVAAIDFCDRQIRADNLGRLAGAVRALSIRAIQIDSAHCGRAAITHTNVGQIIAIPQHQIVRGDHRWTAIYPTSAICMRSRPAK